MIRKSETQRRWYIVQTFPNLENKVKEDLERRIDSLGVQEYIFNVLVPEEKRIEKKADGSEKEVVVQIYPGYVFVEMIVSDYAWFVVRNTPNVSGILGSGGKGKKPVPVPEHEMKPILEKQGLIAKETYQHLVGKQVQIIDGSMAGQQGVVLSADDEKRELVVSILAFGRSTDFTVSVDLVKELKV